MITSTQNQKIQLVRALLGRSKERRHESAFVVEGVRLLEEALSGGWQFRFVLYAQPLSERGQSLLEGLRAAGVEVEEIVGHLLAAVSDTEAPQGLLGVVTRRDLPLPEHMTFALILDEVRDPGNLGSLLRSASAAGVQMVLLTPGCADPFAPKVVRAAMGAHFRLPIRQMVWEALPASLPGLQLILAEMDAPLACWQADLRVPLALMIGGEAQGASPDARQACTLAVHIPMAAGTESLNAAAAGAVLMFEVRRQRSA